VQFRFYLFDASGPIGFHRINVPWDSTSTWSSLGNGLSYDNVEVQTVASGLSTTINNRITPWPVFPSQTGGQQMFDR
jgi:hypothetical protein